MKVLLIRVPKETKKEDSGEKSQQQVQELIAVMETIFFDTGLFQGGKRIIILAFRTRRSLRFRDSKSQRQNFVLCDSPGGV